VSEKKKKKKKSKVWVREMGAREFLSYFVFYSSKSSYILIYIMHLNIS
jgi:hypothetical protein